jgi:2-(1,2-epoxy-1,2-dihydrophenyl)acetyl-CoA isomerase
MEEKNIVTEIHTGVARISFNRPSRRNAISEEMRSTLTTLLQRFASDRSIKVIILRGEGKDFSAGGDLANVEQILAMPPAERSAFLRSANSRSMHPLSQAIIRLPQPLIVSVRGHAIGLGAQLAVYSDIAIASETAKISFPFSRLGHTMDHGESWLLPRKVGSRRALQLLLLGDTIDASTAERYGIVNWVVADDQLDAEVDTLARRLATGATVAIEATKRLLRDWEGKSIEDALSAEEEMLGLCGATEDFREALSAFFERRKPQFVGS